MQRLGIIAHLGKPNIADLVTSLLQWLQKRQVQVLLVQEAARLFPGVRVVENMSQLAREVDALVVLGGDGTILGAARSGAFNGLPVLGINTGRLGFLSELDRQELYDGLAAMLAGHYSIDTRMMLQARVIRNNSEAGCCVALNDAVITKGAFARLITLKVSINGQPVGTYPADGLIVASPTGSTAYSLSAGGPVVTPELELMVLTPICPHALWARPMVIAAQSVVEVLLSDELTQVMLTMDGQLGLALQPGDRVVITRSDLQARFIRLKKHNFFAVMRQKLSEGER
ncbi:MAG: NAD(+)/NADH kinase [Bacillota bacterium]|uniref:NAD(+)/NADH kinase n=1 Tax=Desulfurispora thermophila TaxID=265470 RepID=UPI000476F2A6|nr:NAD(+)/NADH kinase [Desulfurispora thermophila]